MTTIRGIISRSAVTFTMICLWVQVSWAEDALVLRLPFDGTLESAVAQRPIDHGKKNVTFEEGRFGQAVRVNEGGFLWLSLEKLLDSRKGTLSVWIKLSKTIGDTELPYNRIVHVESAEEGFFHTFIRISAKNNKAVAVNLFGLGEGYESYSTQGFSYTDAVRGWKAGEWHHLLLSWYCLKGIRFYDNGILKFSNWDKGRWLPVTPTRLYLNSHPRTEATHAVTFDELRLYAEPLNDPQALALTRGEDIQVERQAERFEELEAKVAAWLEKDVGSLKTLRTLSLLPPVVVEAFPVVKQHLVLSAKMRKVSRREATDGLPTTLVQLGGSLDIELAEAGVDAIEMDGPSPNASVCVAGREVVPSATGKSIRWTLSSPISAKELRLVPQAQGTRISEARFYSSDKKALMPGASPRVLTVTGSIQSAELGVEGDRAAGPLYSMPQQALLAAESAEAGIEITGPRVDILTPPFPSDTGVKAVGIQFLMSEPLPTLARLKLTTVAESHRALFRMDARIATAPGTKQGQLALIMDWPDYYVTKGDRIWLTAIFDKPVKIVSGAKVILYMAPLEAVRAEFAPLELGWFAQWYSDAAEAHRWDSKDYKPDPEIRWLENVLKADPSNPLAIAYYNRIFHRTKEVRATIPGPEKAPLWARAEREALRRTADVVHWWIDKRQTEDGQFGGGWNDDVELHGWDLLVLGCGDTKVLESLRRLNDGIWSPERFTKGYSNRIWDVEHAAEDSSYSQPRMVALEYGNPKWLERCMETISNFDFWTAINPKGHRHFKSFMFQAQEIRPGPEYDSDMADCARAMKPGNYVVWYNNNELVKKWFRQWADAWCEDSLKTERGKPAGCLPAEIVFATCALGRGDHKWNEGLKYPLGAITYHTEDEMIAAYLFTGDPKYLRPIEAMIEQGRAADSSCVTWRRLTGDKKFDERFVARAAGAAGGANVIAWLATGDKKFLADGCVETVRRFEETRFLLTEAEPPTDRVALPGNILLREMMLGGIGVWVCGWPQMAVSWQNSGYDFAALVLDSSPKHLKILAYNFGATREMKMRTWELERGTYEVKIGLDRNGDDSADAIASVTNAEVERGLPIEISLAGEEMSVIELSQLTAKPLGKAADLAICEEDAKVSPDGASLTVQVHNIGSLPARDVQVELRADSGKAIGNGTIAELSSPDDLVPRTESVVIKLPPDTSRTVRVIVDPQNAIPEITKLNNVVDARINRK